MGLAYSRRPDFFFAFDAWRIPTGGGLRGSALKLAISTSVLQFRGDVGHLSAQTGIGDNGDSQGETGETGDAPYLR